METAVGGRRKRILNLVLTIAVNLAIVGYIAVREFSPQIRDAESVALSDMRPIYLVPAAGCFLAALAMEYIKYRRMIMAAAGRDDRRGALHCAILGKYYDNITPFGAGGQPFQMYYLKKRGLSTGVSGALPVAGFLCLQFAFVLLAVVVFITNHSVAEGLPVVRAGAYVGLVFYMFIPLCAILFAVFPKPFEAVVCALTRFLGRLHILRNGQAAAGKVLESLEAYIVSFRSLNSRKYFLFRLMAYSLVYRIAILSVPYFVLRAFGGTGDWWTVFSLVVYIYAAITVIPTPGNAGAAEGTFYAVFSSLAGGALFWAMLVWRAVVYYSWLAAGLILVAGGRLYREDRLKKAVPGAGPLRVGLFTDLFYPSVDGVIRTVDAYAKRMNTGENYACVVCPRQGRTDDTGLGYDVIRTPSISVPGFAFAVPLPILPRGCRGFFRRGRFDVLHAHSPFFVGELALRLGRRLGIPVVATFHSKYYDDALHITHSRFLANLLVNRVVDFYSRADIVWACSRSTAETLRGYGYRGEIQVMENGVEAMPPEDRQSLIHRAADRFGIDEGRQVLLFVGQQIWQKNLRLVLDTAKRLTEDGWDGDMVIVGGGYHSGEIKKYAASLGLGQHIIFTGQVTDRTLLWGLYYLADLFFFPSMYDNSPLVLREAALAGLPALLTEGANAAEVVTDGYNGYTAEKSAAAMAHKIEEIFTGGDPAGVGRRAEQTIPVSWDCIVGMAMAAYRGGKTDIRGGA